MLTATTAVLKIVVFAQLVAPAPRPMLPPAAPNVARAVVHQNLVPAGRLVRGVLALGIDIVESAWRPEGAAEPEVPILAFAEPGKLPSVPGPLLRARVGTAVVITVRNRSDSTVVIGGLRPGSGLATDTVQVPAGATREVRHTLSTAGTYYYWGAFVGLQPGDRFWKDSQLNGAIVVDPPGAIEKDRILVLSEWFFLGPDGRTFEVASVINGKGWPHSEVMEFTQGDSVRFRVINFMAFHHPMHLHGFFYRIVSRGDGRVDRPVPANEQLLSNTDLIPEGGTYSLRFEASTPGNWLYHCHFAFHIDETSSLHGAPTDSASLAAGGGAWHRSHGPSAVPMPSAMEHMRGLVVGIRVKPRPGYVETTKAGARALHLYAQQSQNRFAGGAPMRSYVLQRGDSAPKPDSVVFPSSVIELRRGEPVRVVVHNNLPEATAVHWHGLEIESFPDGVPYWSGLGDRVFSMIAPRDSFAAEFTPPRSGTYPYHTHFNDRDQMTSGLYGAVLVTDGPRDLSHDHLVVIGGRGPWVERAFESPYGAVNGGTNPRPLVLTAGETHRLRIVSLHPDWAVNIVLQNDSTVAQWTPIAKDGADLPSSLQVAQLARTRMGAGETADFAFTPSVPGDWVITVHAAPGGFTVTQRIRVVALEGGGGR